MKLNDPVPFLANLRGSLGRRHARGNDSVPFVEMDARLKTKRPDPPQSSYRGQTTGSRVLSGAPAKKKGAIVRSRPTDQQSRGANVAQARDHQEGRYEHPHSRLAGYSAFISNMASSDIGRGSSMRDHAKPASIASAARVLFFRPPTGPFRTTD